MAQANKQNVPGGSVEIVDTPVTATIPTPLDVASPAPLDVSAANVPVESASTLAVQEAAPMDVSGATVPVESASTLAVQEAAAMDVSAAVVSVEVQNNINNIAGQYLSLAGTPEALASAACESAIVQSDEDNANPVYIGFDNTVAAGNAIHRLQPGKSISINIDNTNRIWVIGTAAQIVRVLRVNIV